MFQASLNYGRRPCLRTKIKCVNRLSIVEALSVLKVVLPSLCSQNFLMHPFVPTRNPTLAKAVTYPKAPCLAFTQLGEGTGGEGGRSYRSNSFCGSNQVIGLAIP